MYISFYTFAMVRSKNGVIITPLFQGIVFSSENKLLAGDIKTLLSAKKTANGKFSLSSGFRLSRFAYLISVSRNLLL